MGAVRAFRPSSITSPSSPGNARVLVSTGGRKFRPGRTHLRDAQPMPSALPFGVRTEFAYLIAGGATLGELRDPGTPPFCPRRPGILPSALAPDTVSPPP